MFYIRYREIIVCSKEFFRLHAESTCLKKCKKGVHEMLQREEHLIRNDSNFKLEVIRHLNGSVMRL